MGGRGAKPINQNKKITLCERRMSNSPEAIKNFPFPFTTDSYMYSVNIQPVTDKALFDVDEHYHPEIEERESHFRSR